MQLRIQTTQILEDLATHEAGGLADETLARQGGGIEVAYG